MSATQEAAEGTLLACDVCGSDFAPEDDLQKRCSRDCRALARRHIGDAATLPRAWAALRASELAMSLAICPSGKVRHQRKQSALNAAWLIGHDRFSAFPDWLSVYECKRCFNGWHLTSKPQRLL